MISHEELLQTIRYEPETGKFFRLKSRTKNHLGEMGVPYCKSTKISTISINGRTYRANKLAFYYVTGEWPDKNDMVTFVDGNCRNFKYTNLKIKKRKILDDLTYDDVVKILDYDQHTGIFKWRTPTNKGKIAGCVDIQNGYRRIKINGKLYRAHRLAFLFMTKEWPSDIIDHINGLVDDNRWCNLREVDDLKNTQNQKVNKNNTSGTSGVNLKFNGKWASYINLDGIRAYLGSFKTKEEAIAARKLAEKQHNYNQSE